MTSRSSNSSLPMPYFNHCHELFCSDCQKLQATRIITFWPKLHIIWLGFLSQHRFRFWGGAHSCCCAHQGVPAGARVCEVSKAWEDRCHETRRESRQGHSALLKFEILYLPCFASSLIDSKPHRWARFQSIHLTSVQDQASDRLTVNISFSSQRVIVGSAGHGQSRSASCQPRL